MQVGKGVGGGFILFFSLSYYLLLLLTACVESSKALLVVCTIHCQLKQVLRKGLDGVNKGPSAISSLEVERKGFTIKALEPGSELVLLVGHKEVGSVSLDLSRLKDVYITPLLAPQAHKLGEGGESLALRLEHVFPCFIGSVQGSLL